MNRPDVHNAFNAQLITDLTDAFQAVSVAEGVRVVILAGRGKSFSAGADLNWMKAAGEASLEANFEDALKLANMLRALAELEKPTIARVQGAALGGGMGLAAACDICVASLIATFATSEVRFGIIPSAISPYVVRAIGARQSSRYFLTAERIDALRAMQIGLVHEAADDQGLDAAIVQIVRSLFAGGAKAQSAAKMLIRDVSYRPICDELVEETARRIAALRSTPEAKEGLAAFIEKRPPHWTV